MTIENTGFDICKGLFLKGNIHEEIYPAFAMEPLTSVNNALKQGILDRVLVNKTRAILEANS